MTTEEKKINITPLFEKAGIQTARIEIIETAGMYPYKSSVEENWAFYTAVGFKRLKQILDSEKKKVETFAIVGIGSGVEGILATNIFNPSLKQLIVTDIDADVTSGAKQNIDTANNGQAEVISLIGSLCEPLEKAGYTVDLIHGNIPNLPAQADEDLTKGAEKGTFLPASLYENYYPPREFISWAAGAQYAYLVSAQKTLQLGGSVVTELGGRLPLEVVDELFQTTGFGKPAEVIVGFKEQTEPLIDFLGYERFEKEFGVSFDYYLFDEAQKTLTQNGFINPSSQMSGADVKKLLAPHRISAGDAVKLHHQGKKAGHTVHLFRGIKV